MAVLPTDTRLKVEQKIEDGMVIQEFRPYLGISGIGDPCARKIWYAFRLCKQIEIPQRLHRLFQRGHREEEIIQTDLRRIGVVCHVDKDNQPEVVDGNGHIRGHVDDILDNIPDAPKTTHLGEYKTHNDKSFKDVQAKGVKKSKKVHWVQMICYMYKLKLKRGLYVAVNKNDDSRYYERISADNEKAKEYISRGLDIIRTEIPPQKIGSATWFECKWCNYYEICHFGEVVHKTCRSCVSADICDDGIWECSNYGRVIPWDRQQIACKRYKLMESLAK